MARQGPRLHRLPQRLDYTLIPAPLDMSLPSITEKSPLPAIIVTPSSPIHPHDFSIAFLAPPAKPSVRERVVNSVHKWSVNSWTAQSRSFRTFLILALLFFVMITTHLITQRHSIYPYSRFQPDVAHRRLATDPTATRVAQFDTSSVPVEEHQAGILDWIDYELKKVWMVGGGVAVDDFIVEFDQSNSLPGVV